MVTTISPRILTSLISDLSGYSKTFSTTSKGDVEKYIKRDFCFRLHLSLLQGEYYHPRSSDLIKLLIKVYNELIVKIDEEGNSAKELREKIDFVKDILFHYLNLITKIHHRQNDNVIHLEPLLDEKRNWGVHDVFILSVRLAEIDEGFSASQKNLKELVSIRFKLETESNAVHASILNIIVAKCNLLILKILRRLQKSDKQNTSYSYLLRTDNDSEQVEGGNLSVAKEVKIEEDELIKAISPYFESIVKTSLNHYTKSKDYFKFTIANVEKIEKYIDSLSISTTAIKIEDIHFVCKFVKENVSKIISGETKFDCNRAEILLVSIKTKARELLAENKRKPYNINALETAFLLVSGALYRLKATKIINELTTTNIKNGRNDLTNLSKDIETEISQFNTENNYPTPYFMLKRMECIVLLDFLEKLSSLQFLEAEVDVYEIYKEFIDKLNEYKSHLYRSKQLALMPIYLFVEECLIKWNPTTNIGDEENFTKEFTHIFLDSGYVLPTNYNHLEVNLTEDMLVRYRNAQLQLMKLTTQKPILDFERKINGFETSNIDLKTAINSDTKAALKDHQYSMIQIIALYASFITFILGSVSIIPKFEHNIAAIFSFMFVFVTGLGLFLFVLRMVFKDKSDKISFADFIEVKEEGNLEWYKKWKFSPNFIFSILFSSLLVVSLFIIWYNSDKNAHCNECMPKPVKIETTVSKKEETTNVTSNKEESTKIISQKDTIFIMPTRNNLESVKK